MLVYQHLICPLDRWFKGGQNLTDYINTAPSHKLVKTDSPRARSARERLWVILFVDEDEDEPLI